MGRVPSIQNGPRAIDLDIVFYDDVAFDTRTSEDLSLTDELVVPHPKLAEREFVLRPLFEYVSIILTRSLSQYLRAYVA